MFSLFLENSGLDLTKEVDKSELTDLDETYQIGVFYDEDHDDNIKISKRGAYSQNKLVKIINS